MAKNVYDKTHTTYVGKIRTITNRNEIIRQWVIKGDLVSAMELLKKQMRELSLLHNNYEKQFASYRFKTRPQSKTAKKK